ncbi:MAG: peroxiredoxin family protein [Bacteroidales bacterium]
MQFIKEHTNSYAAVEQLKFKMTQIPQDTLQKYYDKLSPEFKETQYGKVLHTHLNSRLAEKGGQYIDFEAKTIEGEKFKLSEIKDKYILLNFWSSNCGGCRMANKALAEKYAELKDHIEWWVSMLIKTKKPSKKQ